MLYIIICLSFITKIIREDINKPVRMQYEMHYQQHWQQHTWAYLYVVSKHGLNTRNSNREQILETPIPKTFKWVNKTVEYIVVSNLITFIYCTCEPSKVQKTIGFGVPLASQGNDTSSPSQAVWSDGTFVKYGKARNKLHWFFCLHEWLKWDDWDINYLQWTVRVALAILIPAWLSALQV